MYLANGRCSGAMKNLICHALATGGSKLPHYRACGLWFFNGLGSGKFAIPVGLKARSTRTQFPRFPPRLSRTPEN